MSNTLHIILALLVLSFAAVVHTEPATRRHAPGWFLGEGTQYTLSTPSNGNCNLMSFPAIANIKYAAINRPQFKHTAVNSCGRCALVSCVDETECQGATQRSEVVYIVDQCPECVRGDLDLSPEVFRSITGHENDRVAIQWQFVECPVQGTIQYCLNEGSNRFWTAIQPTNFAVGVQSLHVNGQPTTMVDSAYYFVYDGKSTVQSDLSTLSITLTSVSGEVIHETISLADGGCVDSQYQFSVSNGAMMAADFSGGDDVRPSTTPVINTTPLSTDAAQEAAAQSSSSGSTYRLRRGDTEDATLPAPSSTEPPGIDQVTKGDNDSVHATSPALLVLMLAAATCVVVLLVLAVIVKHKRRLQRESMAKHDVDHVSELPKHVVRQSSYEELATPSRQADIAVR